MLPYINTISGDYIIMASIMASIIPDGLFKPSSKLEAI